MGEQDWLAEQFEAHSTRLRAVAYRMLGSATEADDAVQDAWLRFSHVGANGVNNLSGWLTTLVARSCLDLLRARASRQEQPLGVHVPDPVISRADGIDPEQRALMAEGVGLALLVVLETLTPAERLAFVLHDMFAVPFEEIAPIVGRSPTAARQLASRARRRVQGRRSPMLICPASEQSLTRSSLPRAMATSRRLWRFSTQMWCSKPTSGSCRWASRRWSAALGPSPSRRSPSRGSPRSCSRHW